MGRSPGIFFLLLLFYILSAFTGCPSSWLPEAPLLPEGSNIEQNSNLFGEDPESGLVTFSTNDTKYSGPYGYTLWAEGADFYAPFSHLNVTLSKQSGDDTAGYGVTFCSKENSMLLVLINTRKEYLVGELTGNKFTGITEWEESANLVSGYNQTNILDITLDQETGRFFLAFNGGDPVVFRDDEEPYHTEGRNGFMVVISPDDDFPEIPVTAAFERN